MNIPINRNIERYKEDAWRGLGKKEAASIALIMLIDVGGGLGLIFFGRVNVVLAVCLLLPFTALAGIVGFFPADFLGMGMRDYFKMLWNVHFSPTILYQAPLDAQWDVRFAELGGRVNKKNKKQTRKEREAKNEAEKIQGI